MRTKPFNLEVLYADADVVQVCRGDIAELKELAKDNSRKRIRLCTHRDVSDRIHEMLIVHEQGTYVRPHKHMNRGESLSVLEGSADAVFFDELGTITEVLALGDYASGACWYYRMDDPAYHTLLIHSPQFVFHEVTSGPFAPAGTVFAPWSPAEEDRAALEGFLAELTRKAGQFREEQR